MIYQGLGKGSIIERNKNRIAYVKALSNDMKQLENLVDKLINNLTINDVDLINSSISTLFYEVESDTLILDAIEKFNILDNVSKFRNDIIKRYTTRPEKGFIWNCYNLLVSN